MRTPLTCLTKSWRTRVSPCRQPPMLRRRCEYERCAVHSRRRSGRRLETAAAEANATRSLNCISAARLQERGRPQHNASLSTSTVNTTAATASDNGTEVGVRVQQSSLTSHSTWSECEAPEITARFDLRSRSPPSPHSPVHHRRLWQLERGGGDARPCLWKGLLNSKGPKRVLQGRSAQVSRASSAGLGECDSGKTLYRPCS